MTYAAMSNIKIDIRLRGDLTLPMEIAFRGSPGGKVTAYKIDPKAGLIFFWSKPEGTAGVVELPFKLDVQGAADFAKRWLNEQDYGPQPDHDGSNSQGWRLYNDNWGMVDGQAYSFIAVQPLWAQHGK